MHRPGHIADECVHAQRAATAAEGADGEVLERAHEAAQCLLGHRDQLADRLGICRFHMCRRRHDASEAVEGMALVGGHRDRGDRVVVASGRSGDSGGRLGPDGERHHGDQRFLRELALVEQVCTHRAADDGQTDVVDLGLG